MKKQILIISVIMSLFLISFVYAEATCQALGDVNILFDNGNGQYGINKPLTNVTVTVKPTVGNISQIPVEMSLYKMNADGSKGAEIATGRKSFKTDNFGKAIINCPGTITCVDISAINKASGDYILRAYIPSINKSAEAQLHIMKTLKITLSCVPTSYAVGRTAKCTWNVEDRDKIGLLVSAEPTVKITQLTIDGLVEIQPTSIGTNAVEFITPQTSGTVDVKVSVTKDGYIGDSSTFPITITPLARKQTLYVDNKKYPDDFVGSALSTGSHTLKFVVDESGSTVPILNIDSKLRTPTGEIIPLVFTSSGNDWNAATDKIQTTGQTYVLSGTIYFVDSNKENIPFEYSLTTAGSIIDKPGFDWGILTWIFVGVVVVIIIAVIFGFFVRKRK